VFFVVGLALPILAVNCFYRSMVETIMK